MLSMRTIPDSAECLKINIQCNILYLTLVMVQLPTVSNMGLWDINLFFALQSPSYISITNKNFKKVKQKCNFYCTIKTCKININKTSIDLHVSSSGQIIQTLCRHYADTISI